MGAFATKRFARILRYGLPHDIFSRSFKKRKGGVKGLRNFITINVKFYHDDETNGEAGDAALPRVRVVLIQLAQLYFHTM